MKRWLNIYFHIVTIVFVAKYVIRILENIHIYINMSTSNNFEKLCWPLLLCQFKLCNFDPKFLICDPKNLKVQIFVRISTYFLVLTSISDKKQKCFFLAFRTIYYRSKLNSLDHNAFFYLYRSNLFFYVKTLPEREDLLFWQMV